jgi:hypothetical protein
MLPHGLSRHQTIRAVNPFPVKSFSDAPAHALSPSSHHLLKIPGFRVKFHPTGALGSTGSDFAGTGDDVGAGAGAGEGDDFGGTASIRSNGTRDRPTTATAATATEMTATAQTGGFTERLQEQQRNPTWTARLLLSRALPRSRKDQVPVRGIIGYMADVEHQRLEIQLVGDTLILEGYFIAGCSDRTAGGLHFARHQLVYLHRLASRRIGKSFRASRYRARV